MYPENENPLMPPAKKSPGAITRAIEAVGITSNLPTDPDTDGRRQYSQNYGDAFAYRGGSFAPTGPSNGPASTALDPVRTTVQSSPAPVSRGQLASQNTNIETPQATHTAGVPGNYLTQGVDFSAHMSPQQRSEHAEAYRDGVDKATGTGPGATLTKNPGGAVDFSTMEKRFDAYKKDDGLLATRNIREDLLGSGIRMSKGANGGVVISNDGNQSNPLLSAGGSSIDMHEGNASLARANQARGEMINSMVAAQGGNGAGILAGIGAGEADRINAERTQRWQIDSMRDDIKRAGPRSERAALSQILQSTIAGQNQLAVESMRQQGELNNRGIMADIEKARLTGLDQRAVERNQIQMRGQDMTAATAAERIASQESMTEMRTQNAGTRLNLQQSRSNFEIDAVRERVNGMDPAEIKRKTANYTATGRENPDFDPTLAKAVSLAGRRKYGDDEYFDLREQPQQPAGTDGDVLTRFRADQAMQGHKTGTVTDQGVEVLDSNGRLIGYYR